MLLSREIRISPALLLCLVALQSAAHAQSKFRLDPNWPKPGKQKLETVEADQVYSFHYQPGSLRPRFIPENAGGGMGMGGYGEEADGGYGMGAGYGGGGYEGGGYGSEMGMDAGGYGPGPGMRAPRSMKIYAATTRAQDEASFSQITLLVRVRQNKAPEGYGGYGGGGDYSTETSPGGGLSGGMGGDDYGGDAGYGGGASYGSGGRGSRSTGSSMRPGIYAKLAQFESSRHEGTKSEGIEAEELKVISDFMQQHVWHLQLVSQIQRKGADQAFILQAEPRLKELLANQYSNQLDRQKIEIATIEQKVAQLKSELVRRESAMQRVVEVQSGRIILEAQGLLNRE